jgi:hypothetical protein
VGFKGNKESEAEPIYEPAWNDKLTKEEALLVEVSEKYNLIMGFLKGYTAETREFLSFLISGIIEKLESLDDV